MMLVTFWLSIVESETWDAWEGLSGELWVRRIRTGFLPTVGKDQVVLWGTEEEGAQGGPLWDVKRRFMDAEGGWHVELTRIVVDPPARVSDAIMRRVAQPGHPRIYEHRCWWAKVSGHPAGPLRAAGWRPYAEESK